MAHSLRVLQAYTARELDAELERIGAETSLRDDWIAQAELCVLRLDDVSPKLARFVYQELMLEGGQVALPARMDERAAAPINLLLIGTRYQLRHLAIRLRTQSENTGGGTELDALADDLDRALTIYADAPHDASVMRGTLTMRGTSFVWGTRTFVMGIVNVTPDSFSGDGLVTQGANFVERAVAHAEQLLADGADILDVGGESTRPGSQSVSVEAELARVIPVIKALRARVNAPISIDTYKAEVARAALEVGADLVNDVWGWRAESALRRVVAERGVPLVLMHNKSKRKDAAQSARLGARYVGVEYADLLGAVTADLRAQIDRALDAGIAPGNLIVDPGIGFGKTREHNLELLRRLGELRVLGHPILLGTSRKAFIGYTLDVPPDQRVEGTLATIVLGIERGADMVRVHDVKSVVRVAKMTDAVVRKF